MNGYYSETEPLEALEDIIDDIEAEDLDYDDWDDVDDLDDIDDFGDFDDEDSAERRRRWRRRRRSRRYRRPPRTSSGRNLFRRRVSGKYATQAQLKSATARIGKQIKTNATAIKSLNGRVRSVNDELQREISTRRKETSKLKKDLRQTREMSALLPLLSRPSTVTLTAAAGNLPVGTKVMVDTNDTFGALLPMLLLSGSGGMFGSGGSGGDNNMMMLAMVLALGNK